MQAKRFRPGIRSWLAVVLLVAYGVTWASFQPRTPRHAQVMSQFDSHATAIISDTSKLDRLNQGWTIVGIVAGTLFALDIRRRSDGKSLLIALAVAGVAAALGVVYFKHCRNQTAQTPGQEERYETR